VIRKVQMHSFLRNTHWAVKRAGDAPLAVMKGTRIQFYVLPPCVFDNLAEELWEHSMASVIRERIETPTSVKFDILELLAKVGANDVGND